MTNPHTIAAQLSEAQRQILVAQDPEYAWYTTALAKQLETSVEEVRRACRELRDLELLVLQPAFCEDEGTFRGSAWFPRHPLGLAVRKVLLEADNA